MHPASTQPVSDANPRDTTPPARIGPRVFWTIVLLGLLVLALRGCHNARREVRKSSCCYNLKFIALSLQDYQDTYGSLPPVHLVDSAGTPIHSWRTMISPYYFYNSETDYFAQLDLSKPWDDPVNTAVLGRYVGTMQCPDRDDNTSTTQYVAVFGEGTA